MKNKSSAYASAGVNIDAKMAALSEIKKLIKSTGATGKKGRAVSGIGMFGGVFPAPGKDKTLIASTDGVGTKLKVAAMSGRYDTVGQDLVNHCVNDILVHGADPLFFLDYYGASRFDKKVFKASIAGICKACRENGVALIGGETAEMPGVYRDGEYDLIGTIVGVIGRGELITGKAVRPGDAIIGLASSGLHTNGYSLARKIFFEQEKLSVADILPGTRNTVEQALLAIHRSYLKPVRELRKCVAIRAMAHITGGGFEDNIPRVLPPNVDAVIDRASWTVPPLFRFLQERGNVGSEEMYRVFNMGIGLVIIIRRAEAEKALGILRNTRAQPSVIGRIEKGTGCVKLIG